MRRFSVAIAAATLIASTVQGGMPAARAGGGATAYYLALGDSLAAGYQPGRPGIHKGYVDDLWRSARQQIPGLGLRDVGCRGETTRSMITGVHTACRYATGSQLDAAVAFLEAHPGQVAFITIDIGVNDLLSSCIERSGLIDKACAVDLVPRIQSRLSQIFDALATAGPGVPIVAMTYYDPFLGFWGLVPGGRLAAHAYQRAWRVFNAGLETAFGDAGVTVADVASTFRIDDFTHTVMEPGRGRIPVNVALACRWTWFCSARHAGDPHATSRGYRKIAHTFYRELRALLP